MFAQLMTNEIRHLFLPTIGFFSYFNRFYLSSGCTRTCRKQQESKTKKSIFELKSQSTKFRWWRTISMQNQNNLIFFKWNFSICSTIITIVTSSHNMSKNCMSVAKNVVTNTSSTNMRSSILYDHTIKKITSMMLRNVSPTKKKTKDEIKMLKINLIKKIFKMNDCGHIMII